jgi:predicted MPP superfamily phosphohydrolase
MRILHFSDFHLRPNKQGERSMDIFNRMMDKLQEINQEANIDLVIFSGDMIDKGGKYFGKSLAECLRDFKDKIITPLVNQLQIGYHQFLFVPGNHEVVRDLRNDVSIGKIKTENGVEDFLGNNDTVPHLQDFLCFQKEYYDLLDVPGLEVKHNGLSITLKMPINGKMVGISLLNTAWMCGSDNDRGKIMLGLSQINPSWSGIADCQIKIAISHHHYNFLEECDGNKISEVLHKHYDIYAVGHTHGMKTTHEEDENGSLFISVAAGNLYDNLHEERKMYKNGFTILDYNDVTRYLDVTPYEQQTDGCFEVDRNYGTGGTKRFEDTSRSLFNPLDTWLKSYVKQFAILDNEEMKQKRALLKDKNNQKVLLAALSGLGKTRMVYETFNDGHNHPNHFYAELTNENENWILNDFSELVSKVSGEDAVIIVDNCSNDLCGDIFRRAPGNVKTIVITNEYYDVQSSPNVVIIKIDSLTLKNEVASYIDQNIVGEENQHLREEVKKIADGFPSMACELVETYKNGNQVELCQADLLVSKLLRASGKGDDEHLEALKTLSLFQPFPLPHFNRAAYEFIINNDILLQLKSEKPGRRRRVINETKNRFTPTLIEDTGSMLNVRPFPLAVYLAKDWFVGLDEYMIEQLFDDFEKLKKESDSAYRLLVDSLAKRIEYMKNLPLAEDFIVRLTDSEYGPFANEKVVCSQMGSRIFLAMASVNPVAVTNCLYSLLVYKNTQWLKDNISGDIRRNLVWALEKLCFDKDSFMKASIVMAQLMLAENESYGNNATGQFLQLFHVVLPGTEANLVERVSLLSLLMDKGQEYFSIVIKALDSAFVSHGFHRSSSAERFGIEEKRDYMPSHQEVWDYWYACRDIVIRLINEKEELQGDIYKLVIGHAFVWISDGYFDTIFRPIVEPLQKRQADFADLYNHLLRDRRNSMLRRYSPVKKTEIQEFLQNLRPPYFSSSLKEAQNSLYNERRIDSTESYFEKLEKVLMPLARTFIDRRVFANAEELKRLADVNLFIEHAFFLDVAKLIDDDDLGDFWNITLELVREYSDEEKMPSFLSSMCYVTRERKVTLLFRGQLLKIGYAKWYIGLSAKCENEHLDVIRSLIHKEQEGCFEKEIMIDVYLNNVAINKHQELFKILRLLYDSYENISVRLLEALINFTFMCDEEDLKNNAAFIEQLILEYPIDDSNPHLNYEYTRYTISVLERHHDAVFAKKMNKKLIEGFNHGYLHSNFDGLCSILLEKYTDEVWNDFEAAFTDDKYLGFILQVKNEIGSGAGFGAGPLFQLGNERIKDMCLKHPNNAPVRIAEMMPIYDGNMWECNSFSEIMQWILDTYGNQAMVLSGIHANIHTFGWTGSVIGLFQHHKMCMEQLLNHKITEVREWAANCIQEFDEEIKRETLHEDYVRLHYQ